MSKLFKNTFPVLCSALRNACLVSMSVANPKSSLQGTKAWLQNPFPKPPPKAVSSRWAYPLALIAWSAIIAPGCKHTCDADDPLGLIGEWDAVEVFEQYENGQLTQNLPNAYVYKFMAGHAGEKTHINGIYPTESFSWTVDSDGAGLFFHELANTATTSNSNVIRYTVLTSTEQSKSCRSTFNNTYIDPVTLDTTYIESVFTLDLQKN